MRYDAPLTRRSFLRLVGLLGAALVARQLTPLGALGRAIGRDSLASRLVRLFRSPASASLIGEAYLQHALHEADERRLLGLVCPTGRRWHTADPPRLRRMLGEQQADDFRHGRIVQVQGWILSATEARLCALAAVRERAV